MQLDITNPLTLHRRATAPEGEAFRLRIEGRRDLAGRADHAARQYRDAADAIAHARNIEDAIAAEQGWTIVRGAVAA